MNFSPKSANQEDSGDHAQTFLFIHQTKEQQRLLQRYGNNLSLLDATYKTCKYELPLFLLCVATNIGYSVVGTFIVERETSEAITEALHHIKQWNPEWKPSYFLVDFDESEINAIETLFPGTLFDQTNYINHIPH